MPTPLDPSTLLTEKIMKTFKYDQDASYESNFNRWRLQNNDERSAYNEPLIVDTKEAQKVFDKFMGDKLSHSIKINTDGVLEDVLVLEE